eukprot:XP_015141661.1 anoctamin-3 isoform X4 [Gallus gallus]
MSAVIIELDKLSSDESESRKDSKSGFKEGKLSEFCAEYCGFQLHCSHSAPAGMNTSKSEMVKEHSLKPSRRSMPCLAQSQTHPQSLSKHSSFLQPNRVQPQPQPLSAGASTATVDVVSERAKVMETLENNLLKLSSTEYSDPFLDIGKDKDPYTDDSEHGNYDVRTDQSLLIQNKLTRQKTEPRTKSSLKVVVFAIWKDKEGGSRKTFPCYHYGFRKYKEGLPVQWPILLPFVLSTTIHYHTACQK